MMEGWIQLWYTVRTLVNVTMFPSTTIIMKKETHAHKRMGHVLNHSCTYVAGHIGSKPQNWILMLFFLLKCAKDFVSQAAMFGTNSCLRTKTSILICKYSWVTLLTTYCVCVCVCVWSEHPCACGRDTKTCIWNISISITITHIRKPKSCGQSTLTLDTASGILPIQINEVCMLFM
jgi:hypothetical protein